MVDYCGLLNVIPLSSLGNIVPRRMECLYDLTPEQTVQHMVNRIPNAAMPRVSRRK